MNKDELKEKAKPYINSGLDEGFAFAIVSGVPERKFCSYGKPIGENNTLMMTR